MKPKMKTKIFDDHTTRIQHSATERQLLHKRTATDRPLDVPANCLSMDAVNVGCQKLATSCTPNVTWALTSYPISPKLTVFFITILPWGCHLDLKASFNNVYSEMHDPTCYQ